jgi:hypothetical protein
MSNKNQNDQPSKSFENYSPAPWSYEYRPYTTCDGVRAADSGANTEIPAFEICDADGNKIFDTYEHSLSELQEANARLVVAAPEMLQLLMECARLLADHDQSNGEEGELYGRIVVLVEEAC